MARTKKAAVEQATPKVSVADVRDLQIIIKPIVTEKTMKLMQDQNKITLKVIPSANAIQVKNAFVALFNKKVEKVNMMNVRAKDKRVGKFEGKTSAYKKAIVTLKKGEALDLFNQGK